MPYRRGVQQLRVPRLYEERSVLQYQSAPDYDRGWQRSSVLSFHQHVAGHVLHRAGYARLASLRLVELDLDNNELVCEGRRLVVDVEVRRHADLLW